MKYLVTFELSVTVQDALIEVDEFDETAMAEIAAKQWYGGIRRTKEREGFVSAIDGEWLHSHEHVDDDYRY